MRTRCEWAVVFTEMPSVGVCTCIQYVSVCECVCLFRHCLQREIFGVVEGGRFKKIVRLFLFWFSVRLLVKCKKSPLDKDFMYLSKH